MAQRGLWSIIERRYRERSVKTKEKVHDELAEKRNGPRRLKDSYLQWKSDIETTACGLKDQWHDTYEIFCAGKLIRDWLAVLGHRMRRS